jgi:DNA polymerase III alpha subunit
MVFAKIEDTSGDTEAVVFPRVYQENPGLWEGDRTLVVTGRPSEKDGKMHILVESAYEITPENIDEIARTAGQGTKRDEPAAVGIPSGGDPAVTLHVRAKLPDTVLIRLRRILDAHPGEVPVYFLIDDVDGHRRIKTSSRISFGEEVSKDLEGLLGPGTVKVGM